MTLSSYSQIIYPPKYPSKIKVKDDTLIVINRHQLDLINITYRKLSISYTEISRQIELLKKCELINSINDSIIREQTNTIVKKDSIIFKQDQIRLNLIKKNKLEIKQQRLQATRKTIITGIVGVVVGIVGAIIIIK